MKRRSIRRCSNRQPATTSSCASSSISNGSTCGCVRFRRRGSFRTLLVEIDPSAISELRDRGLLAYHLQDFAAALRDLEEYLRLAPKLSEQGSHDMIAEHDTDDADSSDEQHGDSEVDEATQIWEHVKTLRKRVAGFN